MISGVLLRLTMTRKWTCGTVKSAINMSELIQQFFRRLWEKKKVFGLTNHQFVVHWAQRTNQKQNTMECLCCVTKWIWAIQSTLKSVFVVHHQMSVHQKEQLICIAVLRRQWWHRIHTFILATQSCSKMLSPDSIRTRKIMAFICFLKLWAFSVFSHNSHFWLQLFSTWQMTGTPLSAAKRLQFNLQVRPIPEVDIMKDLREMIFPIFWIEEGAHLDKKFTNKIKNTLFLWVHFREVFPFPFVILQSSLSELLKFKLLSNGCLPFWVLLERKFMRRKQAYFDDSFVCFYSILSTYMLFNESQSKNEIRGVQPNGVRGWGT